MTPRLTLGCVLLGILLHAARAQMPTGGVFIGTGGSGSGGSPLTTQDTNGHSVAKTTQQTFGNGLVVGGTGGTATISPAVTVTNKTANYTVANDGTDMGKCFNLGGSGATLTLQAVGPTNFQPGQSICVEVTASAAWTLTNNTGLAITGFTGTTLGAGANGSFIANADGSHLDFIGVQAPLAGVTTAQGNGAKVQLSTGSTTNAHCVQFDANGNTVDSGAGCGGGGGVTCPTGFTNVNASCAWTQTASASTSLDFTGLSGDNYRLLCYNITVSASAKNFAVEYMQTGSPVTTAAYAEGYNAIKVAAQTNNPAGATTLTGYSLSPGLNTSASIPFLQVTFSGLSQTATHGISFQDYVNSSELGDFASLTGSGNFTGNTNAVTGLHVYIYQADATTFSGKCTLLADAP